MKKRITASALALVMALSVCVSAMPTSNVQAKENDAQVEEDSSQESDETIDEIFDDKKYDSINWETDFGYWIEGDSIVLGGYTGNAEVVNIPATATINGVTYKVKLYDYCARFFEDCDSIKSISFSKDFDAENITDMMLWFHDCDNLQEVDFGGFNAKNVRDMSRMFEGCSSLTSLDLSGFDNHNVVYVNSMFKGCSSLTYLDLRGLDTSNVGYMDGVFEGCSSLTSLDLSGFDTSNVEDMSNMFANCNSLTSLDLSGFDTSNVRDMSDMFANCNSLTSLDLSDFDMTNVIYCSDFFGKSENSILELKTPKNVKNEIQVTASPYKGKRYVQKDNPSIEWDILPMNHSDSIVIVRRDTISVIMYRLYNPLSGEHLYSSDNGEISWLEECGWNNEGASWKASVSGDIVHRLFNPVSGEHHYTIDVSETNWLVSIGWNYEGIGWYSADDKTVPVYRLFNPNTNIAVQSHVYTTDAGERDWLMSTGWNYEGIAWYGM